MQLSIGLVSIVLLLVGIELLILDVDSSLLIVIVRRICLVNKVHISACLTSKPMSYNVYTKELSASSTFIFKLKLFVVDTGLPSSLSKIDSLAFNAISSLLLPINSTIFCLALLMCACL